MTPEAGQSVADSRRNRISAPACATPRRGQLHNARSAAVLVPTHPSGTMSIAWRSRLRCRARHIFARNERFRGRVGEEVPREYVRIVLEKTDLVILPHEYGYSVYRADVARSRRLGARRRFHTHRLLELRRWKRSRYIRGMPTERWTAAARRS